MTSFAFGVLFAAAAGTVACRGAGACIVGVLVVGGSFVGVAVVLAVLLCAALAPALAPVPVVGGGAFGSGAAASLGGLRGFLAGLLARGRGTLCGALIATSTILSGRWSLGFCSARRFFFGPRLSSWTRCGRWLCQLFSEQYF